MGLNSLISSKDTAEESVNDLNSETQNLASCDRDFLNNQEKDETVLNESSQNNFESTKKKKQKKKT